MDGSCSVLLAILWHWHGASCCEDATAARAVLKQSIEVVCAFHLLFYKSEAGRAGAPREVT